MVQPAMVVPTPDEDRVELPVTEYELMASHWELIHDLRGGTARMRDAGEKWLPREEVESVNKYHRRLKSSFLLESYNDAVDSLGSRPFARSIQLTGTETLSDRLAAIERDATGDGQDLTQFAKQQAKTAWDYGVTHILVDYPAVDGTLTLAEEMEMGLRPKFIHVRPPDLIGWRWEISGGIHRLTQIRIRETATVDSGKFGHRAVNRIRVINAPTQAADGSLISGTWELWEQDQNTEEYAIIRESTHTYPGIPLVTMYLNRKGFLVALPPLERLAWLNLAHWQSSSEQRSVLRIARIGILFGSGLTEEESKILVVGADRLTTSVNPDAKLEWVEHSGQAIGAGQADLDKLEKQMEQAGMEPLLTRSGNVTATERAIEEGQSQSDILAAVRTFENFLWEAYWTAGRWIAEEVTEDFKVDVVYDPRLVIKSERDVDHLIQLRERGEISRETLLSETKRRGLFHQEFSVEEEMRRVEAEGPPLGSMSGDGEDAEENAEEEDADSEGGLNAA